jgi:hypothetical protein
MVHPALGAAALICFEWLQRPENVLAGKIAWTGYRPAHHPFAIQKIWQPLEEEVGRLYPKLEVFLIQVPKLGVRRASAHRVLTALNMRATLCGRRGSKPGYRST